MIDQRKLQAVLGALPIPSDTAPFDPLVKSLCHETDEADCSIRVSSFAYQYGFGVIGAGLLRGLAEVARSGETLDADTLDILASLLEEMP